MYNFIFLHKFKDLNNIVSALEYADCSEKIPMWNLYR